VPGAAPLEKYFASALWGEAAHGAATDGTLSLAPRALLRRKPCKPREGGGRLVENAAGSGGSIEEPGGGGVESNRSDNTSCATGAFSSESRLADGGRGFAARRGVASAGVTTGGVITSESGLNGMSSAIGSTSSVRSLPPYGTATP
jgi:hypothetical protein